MDLQQCTNNFVFVLQQKIGMERNTIVKKDRLLRIKDPIGSTNVINR